jgi:diadenosine tetraphosphate (Ap4A) HIT family hydrolase
MASAASRPQQLLNLAYVALFAEAEGFEHVHFHVVPRSPDMDPGLRGPRLFGHLGGDRARHVPAQVMEPLALGIGQALRLDF